MYKIAIIEDDEAVRYLYQVKLEKDGYAVQSAINGVEGLKLIESYQPDIVLLDLMLPQMSGDEMLTEMRKYPWGKSIKVLIMTNLTEDEAPTSLRESGIEDYIIKAQYTPSQVSEIVRQVLAR